MKKENILCIVGTTLYLVGLLIGTGGTLACAIICLCLVTGGAACYYYVEQFK